MLIRTSNIGTNYRKVTVRHDAFRGLATSSPGSCVRINGRYLAVAGHRDNELDFVTGKTSFLDTEAIESVDSLPDTGFSSWSDPAAYLIAAGSGLGAFMPLVERRVERRLETTLHFYGRNIKDDFVLEAFPILSKINFGCWDTVVWGRPRIKQEVLVLPPSHSVFFAGPRSFQLDLQAVPDGPEINLNFKVKQ